MSTTRVAAALLAGGAGRRMGGVSKSFLLVEGEPIIARQLAVLRPLFERVVVVTADGSAFLPASTEGALEVVADRRGPGLGPLAGLDAALAWLPPEFDALVCVAGDMPFLSPAVMAHLRDIPPAAAAAVVPRLGHGAARRPQPLCARYHRSVATAVETQLAAGVRAMHLFLDHLEASASASTSGSLPLVWLEEPQLRALDPELVTFMNINTPADLASAVSGST